MYIKTEGTGNISVLNEISDGNISIMPGHTFTVYPYISGSLYPSPVITEETGCVGVSGAVLTGNSSIKNNKIKINCGDIEIPITVTVPLLEAECEVTPFGDDAKININVPGLKNISSQISVIFFNSDHSMNSVQTFSGAFADESEQITVRNFYSTGDTAKLVIWNNTDNAAAYVKAVDLDMYK